MTFPNLIKKTDRYGIETFLRSLPRSRKPFGKLMNLARFVGGRRQQVLPYGPLEYELDITYRCNLNCHSCFLRQQDYPMKEQLDMPLYEINQVLDKADSSTIAILFGGGEPLLYPDLDRLIHMIVQRGFYCSFSTNGILLEDFGPDLLRAGLHSLNISLDAHNAETYHKIRNAGPRIWNKLIRSVHAFRTLIDDQKKGKRFQFTCNFTLTKQTVPHIKEMVSFAEELRFDVIYFNNINSFGEKDLTLYRDDPEVREILEGVVRTCKPNASVYLPVLVDTVRRGFCRDPFVLTIVKASGAQGRCCFDPPSEENGNLFKDQNSFNSERYQAFRKVFLDERTPLPKECRRCYRRFDRLKGETTNIYYDPSEKQWVR